jgi:hypothetical protein
MEIGIRVEDNWCQLCGIQMETVYTDIFYFKNTEDIKPGIFYFNNRKDIISSSEQAVE